LKFFGFLGRIFLEQFWDFFWRNFLKEFFLRNFLKEFLGRNFLGGFFLGGFSWKEFFGRNYLIEINQELMFLSKFWGIFVSMQGRKEEGRKKDF
jgi:hypothetical protein